jgi:hypothetical protein
LPQLGQRSAIAAPHLAIQCFTHELPQLAGREFCNGLGFCGIDQVSLMLQFLSDTTA